MDTVDKINHGAWIVHHGRKLALDTAGAAEYPALDTAAKTANLLVSLSASEQSNVSTEQVRAIAVCNGLNPVLELPSLLVTLEKKRLIDRTEHEISVLGVGTDTPLVHAHDFFEDFEPNSFERASITLSEQTSQAPARRVEMEEFISDTHGLSSTDTKQLVDQSEAIGFVDAEGESIDRTLFNGNLFRRDNASKAAKILSSLSSLEQGKLTSATDLVRQKGCVLVQEIVNLLGEDLFKKVNAVGLFDLNTVSNELGEHVFVTLPGAFHKFTNPMVDDCFDMAKSLVAALKYGMTQRSHEQGQITMISALLGKLIGGKEVGPAPAIGKDYQALEMNRVVRIRRVGNKYWLKLLKKPVGEMALQVLTTGAGTQASLDVTIPDAPMTGYKGPEEGRQRVRRSQNLASRRQTQDILSVLREGRNY